MRNAPSILLAVALAAPTLAEEFDVLFDQPQLDRWMYPFNSSAGARATMSVFGSDREVPTQFDARDGQILLAFDTDLVIPPGGTAAEAARRGRRRREEAFSSHLDCQCHCLVMAKCWE